MSSLELVLASKWSLPENRRRESLKAIQNHDLESLQELLEYHLRLKSQKAGEVSPATLRSYNHAMTYFLESIGSTAPSSVHLLQVTEEHLERYLITLRQRKLSFSTIRFHLAGLKAFFRALTWAGAIPHNPALGVKAPIDPTPAHSRKQAIPEGVLRDLFALPIQKLEPFRTRDLAILHLGAVLGLRAAEICDLEPQDINSGLKTLTVQNGKGGKQRRIPIPRKSLEVLLAWLSKRQTLELKGVINPKLILSLSRSSYGKPLETGGLRFILEGYYKVLGLPPEMFGAHTLRRTAGTRLYRATRDLHVVADVLGHSSVTTSAIYAKLDDDVRREALEGLTEL